MARPKRGRARPTISLELDCDLESEAVGDSGIIKLLKESHEASPASPLQSCLARILGRKFSQVIGSSHVAKQSGSCT